MNGVTTFTKRLSAIEVCIVLRTKFVAYNLADSPGRDVATLTEEVFEASGLVNQQNALPPTQGFLPR